MVDTLRERVILAIDAGKQFVSTVQVLYFGDHLYSDLRGPAKAGWRTAAVIRELEVILQTVIQKNLIVL